MARETKVGLIVGLGLILFVGMMVSEYFVDTPEKGEFTAAELADFSETTTNQDRRPIREAQTPVADPASDPAGLALAALERSRRFESESVDPRRPSYENAIEPPRRVLSTDDPIDLSGDPTPIALQLRNTPSDPVGQRELHDLRLAAEHQISPERLGPGGAGIEHNVRIDLPAPPVIAIRPRQILHTVRSGETLSSIARKHYDGDGNMWRSIRDANRGKVGSNGEVLEGAELVIPKRSAQALNPTAELAERTLTSNERPARPRVRLITVKDGQTLSEIAAKHLGDGNKWPLIMAVNDDVLDKPENLRAGMKLRIPAEDEARLVEEANNALARTGEEAEQPAPSAPVKTYTVKEGDSLYRIAAKQLGDGERYKELFEANRTKISKADDIRVGMTLKLPGR